MDGHAIAPKLRADDRHVILRFNEPPPLLVSSAAGESYLEFMATGAEVVVMARIEKRESRLVRYALVVDERGPRLSSNLAHPNEANWIATAVEATILRVVKGQQLIGVSEGDRVTFDEHGGRVIVGQTRIDGVVPWARSFVEGRRYLLFGYVDRNGRFAVRAEGAYEEETPSMPLRRLLRRADTEALRDIEQLSLDGAVGIVEARLRR